MSDYSIPSDEISIESLATVGPGMIVYPNRTTSAVKVTHIPSGLSEESFDHRSQLANREEALRRLTPRVRQWREKI
jgi:peptide chain release factor 2